MYYGIWAFGLHQQPAMIYCNNNSIVDCSYGPLPCIYSNSFTFHIPSISPSICGWYCNILQCLQCDKCDSTLIQTAMQSRLMQSIVYGAYYVLRTAYSAYCRLLVCKHVDYVPDNETMYYVVCTMYAISKFHPSIIDHSRQW